MYASMYNGKYMYMSVCACTFLQSSQQVGFPHTVSIWTLAFEIATSEISFVNQ